MFSIPIELSAPDLKGVLPEIILTSFALLIALFEVLIPKSRKEVLGYTSLLGLALSAYATTALWGIHISAFSGLCSTDKFALIFKLIFLFSAALSILLSIHYVRREKIERGEYYSLILFSTIGMMVMSSATDLFNLYVGLELMAISIYILTGFLTYNSKSVESAIKYVVLGTFASCLLLFGISLTYGLSGTSNIPLIAKMLYESYSPGTPIVTLAMIFIMAGFAFKIAAVPFHMWSPDVYEGAPTPITAFMSIGPKAAGFAVIIRVFFQAFQLVESQWQALFILLSILTMTVGNLSALLQNNIKRMLAYSSIAHAGYLLIGVVSTKGGFIPSGLPDGLTAILFYLFVYMLANIGCFAIVIYLGREGVCGDKIQDYSGLGYVSPFAAISLTIFLLSLTGIPPTGGFVGKFYIFGSAIRDGLWWLALIAVINSVISLFYYMRVVMYLFMRESEAKYQFIDSVPLKLSVVICVLFIIYFGILPGNLVNLARQAIANFLR